MKLRLTLFSVFAMLMLSCTESSKHDIAIEDAYKPFSETMILAKTIVQEVLVAAYQNPDLNDFNSEEIASNRNECPDQQDLNPGIFPKTLIYDYGTACTSDSGTPMAGQLEIVVTDFIGTPGMEIQLNPRNNFIVEGSQVTILPGGEFRAVFTEGETAIDNYELHITDLHTVNPELEINVLENIQMGGISFEDVNGNNDPSTNPGPLVYVDDLAVIDFSLMAFRNHKNEQMTVTLERPIKFDLFCACPLEGRLQIRDEKDEIQYVDYSSNSECRGVILVDVEGIECN